MFEIDLMRKLRKFDRRMNRTETKANPFISGTYIPTYTGSVTPGATTYTTQQGWYWRFGLDSSISSLAGIVFVTGLVVWSAATGAGNAQISLPFVPSSFGFRAPVALRTSGVTFANGSIQGIVATAAALFTMESPLTNAASTVVAVEAAGNITFQCFYGVD